MKIIAHDTVTGLTCERCAERPAGQWHYSPVNSRADQWEYLCATCHAKDHPVAITRSACNARSRGSLREMLSDVAEYVGLGL